MFAILFFFHSIDTSREVHLAYMLTLVLCLISFFIHRFYALLLLPHFLIAYSEHSIISEFAIIHI